MGPSVVAVKAHAKVNLYLEVGAKRPDGYHRVDTVLHTLALHDTVTIREANGLSVVCAPDIGVAQEHNLVYRAAVSLAETLGRRVDVAISVDKRIPDGAGLGGGSSDAAATLAGLAMMWEVDPEDPLLITVAAALGADVPFFLGGGAALYAGRGDELVTALPPMSVPVALVKPRESVSTGAAYEAFDRLPHSAGPGANRLSDALRAGDRVDTVASLHNNMTEASVGLVPAIGEALAWCQSARGVLGAAMAGSGSAVFAVCEDAGAADRIARDSSMQGWWGSSTTTAPEGAVAVRVEERQ
ncbi:MAG: 4-(cytidine 5'-diphospho)-2-C-methyl-D-erythritol kinase [Actinomycetota bacterium]|nr:4-(cytidine 5'-diphospho)-2-C-methyl-D-erythritol kinase [Actinomycetota bacterium]